MDPPPKKWSRGKATQAQTKLASKLTPQSFEDSSNVCIRKFLLTSRG